MAKNKELIREAPETWCAGKGMICGYYNIRTQFMSAVSDYMKKHDLSNEDIIGVSGIGCSGRFTVWQDFVTVHTTHGNASNLAHGAALIKSINRKKGLTYIISGDGDALAIGRANFENLCRSNIDVTYIILNNSIYAMTSGQTAPTTKMGVKTISSPYGCIEKPLDIASLAFEFGATFIARTSSYPKESKMLKGILSEAFEHKGTSVIEVISACPTQNPDDRGKKLIELEKEYMDASFDISKKGQAVFPGESPRIRYIKLKNYVRMSHGKDMLIKGVIYKSDEKTYADLIDEQKKEISKKFSDCNLSDKMKKLLEDYKIN